MGEKKYTAAALSPRIMPFLEAVCERADFQLDFEVVDGENPHPDIEDPEVVVRFYGPDVDLLLANKAEVLLALEYLTMESLRMPAEDHERLCFDANDYRMLRIAELRLSAQTAAEKVKRTNVPFRFGPMTSRERRIIHLALRQETAVRSESSGMGPQRQVVIYPAGMPAPPEAAQPAYGGGRPGFSRPGGRPGGGGPGGGGGRGPARSGPPRRDRRR